MNTMRANARAGIVALGLAALFLPPASESAEPNPYPNRPIRIIVPYSPGGVADTLARILDERLESALGAPVVTENRTGAGGNIASELVARSAPDGYTLLVGGAGMAVLHITRGAQAADPLRDFVPITQLATQPILIAVNPGLGVKSLAELVTRARGNRGGIAYATAGIGTTDHLAAALLWSRANVDALHVPYASSGQEIKDLRQGDVQLAFITLGAVKSLVETGQLQALAVTSRQRVAAFPDIPTVAESGFPGFEIVSWYGLFAPAGTPPQVIDRLHREVARILELPEVGARLAGIGAVPVGNTPRQFAEEIGAQQRFLPALIKAAGVPVE